MEIRQPARLVALDTEVFVRNNFNYKSTLFVKLIELSESEKIHLYLTTVVQREVLAHIHQEVQKSKKFFEKLHKEFRKQAKIIHNSQKFNQLLHFTFDEEGLDQELTDKFNSFIEEADVEILSVDSVSPEEVFSKYFDNSPPFGEGKKKHEFPDAFAIAALERKAEVEGKIIYIVSGDNDWQKACNESVNLTHIESIDKLLEGIICEQESEEIDFCYETLEEVSIQVNEEISNQFTGLQFTLSDDFANGCVKWDSEYIEVQVDSVDIIDKSLVSVNDDEPDNPLVIFELKVDIFFTADISYDSLEMAIWDKEDQKYYNSESIKEEVHQRVTVPVEVELNFFRNSSYKLCLNKVERVDLDPNKSMGTIVIKPDGYES